MTDADENIHSVELCRNSSYYNRDAFLSWLNFSVFNTTTQLELYVCAFEQYVELMQIVRKASGYCSFVFGPLGFVSSLLTLFCICFNRRFAEPSYIYFRLTAVLEIINAVFIILTGYRQSLYSQTHLPSYSLLLLMVWFTHLTNMTSGLVDYITTALSVKLAMACLTPTLFLRFNNQKLAYTVCTVSFLINCALQAPSVFAYTVVYDPTTNTYYRTLTEFGMNQFVEYLRFYETYTYVAAAAVVVSTMCGVIGLLKAVKLKSSLRANYVVHPIESMEEMRNRRPSSAVTSTQAFYQTTVQLCYLQICKAMPAACNYVIYAIYSSYTYVTSGFEAISSPTIGYHQAMSDVSYSYQRAYLTFMLDFSNGLAHCMHFYFYIIFSERFRNAFRQRIGCCKTETQRSIA